MSAPPLTSAELARALGPKPQSKGLRKAVEVDLGDPGGFFRGYSAAQGGPRETVQDFASKQRNVSYQDRIILVPLFLGMTPEEATRQLEVYAAYASTFLAPLVRIEVRQLPQFSGPHQLRLFRDPRSGGLNTHQLLLGLERARPSYAARVLAVCVDCPTSSPRETVISGADDRIGILDLASILASSSPTASAQVGVLAVSRAITFFWAGPAPCTYFSCALNPMVTIPRPCVLCPICLRKLSLIAGPPAFDASKRYAGLFKAATSNLPTLRPEAQWYAERLAHLGHYEYVDALERLPRSSQETETLSELKPAIQDSQEASMQADLATLKRRMSASRSKPKAPPAPIYFG